MQNNTFYNPETNKIITGKRYTVEEGFFNLSDKKVAEAFTSVDADERPLLWKAFIQNKTYTFDFSMLNSKLRHKLEKLGLYQLKDIIKTPGEELLKKINNKNE